jgi:acyl transferase domain-containing protein
MVERGLIPPSVHFKKANPRIPFDEWNIEIPTERRQWPTNELRRVSVNSFGFGGTNAHAILDAAGHFLAEKGLHGLHTTFMDESIKPRYLNGHSKVDLLLNGHSEPKPHVNGHANHSVQEDTLHQNNPSLFVLSAQDQDTVNRMKETCAEYLRSSHLNQKTSEATELARLHDLAFTLGSKRSRLPWKAYTLASSIQELSDHWGAPTTTKPIRSSSEPRIGFVFTGQGAQWPRMGVELLQYHTFNKSIQAAESYLRSLGCEWSVTEEMKRQPKQSKMDLPKFSQPLCTIVQVALVDLLRSWNISPSAVVGHSSGEIAAAYCCGAISSEDAWKIAYYRGLYSSKIRTLVPDLEGAMMAVALSEEEAKARVSDVTSGRLVVACINSHVSVTISGDRCAIDELHDILNAEGTFARKLKVENAYHSHHMEMVAAAYLHSIGRVPVLRPGGSVRMFSSVTGKAIPLDTLGPSYWIQNLVSPVKFSEAVSSLLLPSKQRRRRVNDAGVDLFLELGPHPALRGPVKQILEHLSMKSLTYCSILERGKSGIDTALEAAGTLFTSGSSVDLSEVNYRDGDHIAKHLVDLPPYPWNHTQTFWHESRISKNYRFRKHARHDLLGAAVSNFNPLEPQWRNFLKPTENPWIRDHIIQDSILYPAAGLVTMVLEAARQVADSDKIVERYDLRDVQIGKAVLVPDDDVGVECTLQMRPRKIGTRADVASWFEFTIFTTPDGGEFQRNCSGLLAIRYKSSGSSSSADIEAQYENKSYQERYRSHAEFSSCLEDTSKFYESMAAVGLKYGPAFQNVSQIRKGASYCCSHVRIPDTESMMPGHVESPHLVHPGTLDCMFQTAFAALGAGHGPLKEAMVPIFIDSISLSADQPHGSGSEYIGYSESLRHGFREIISDIVMADLEWEEPKITIKGFRCTELSAMTGTLSEDDDSGKQKKMASNILWKPDIDLVSSSQLTKIIENAVADEVKPQIPISTQKLEMAGFVFIERLLKNVPYEKVDIGYVKLFHEWMQARFRSVEEGKHAHQTADVDWMNLGTEKEELLIAEVRASGSHGEALCAIGENLIKIVTGEIEPLQVLLENDLLYRFYREAREMKIMNSKLTKVNEILS